MATLNEVVDGDLPRRIRTHRTRADRAFRGVAGAAGITTFVVLFLIGLFLFLRAIPTFQQNGWSFFTTTAWNPDGGYAGVLAPLYGTIEIAIIAMVIAVPISLLTALFLTEYVPPTLRGPMTSVLDLLAAIPGLIYGVWGFFFLQPHLIGLSAWLTDHFGFIPIFATPAGPYFALSPFIAGVLVSLMLLPTATSVMRDVFSQAPPGEKEAALALGASRWRMIRAVVLPFGRGGIIGGSMLALGRAMGESISVALVLSIAFDPVGAHAADRRQLDRRIHRRPLRRVQPGAGPARPDGLRAGAVCDHASDQHRRLTGRTSLPLGRRGGDLMASVANELITAALPQGGDAPDTPIAAGRLHRLGSGRSGRIGGECVRAGVARLLPAAAGSRRGSRGILCVLVRRLPGALLVRHVSSSTVV